MQPKESTAKTHFVLSIVKSIIRLWACVVLYFGVYNLAALLFAGAEYIGILEEL
jgi:hypothetical protein